MTIRDRVVLGVLVGGVLLAAVAWQVAGPWPALVVGVLAVLGACVAYRVEPPSVRIGEWPWRAEERASASADRGEGQ